MVNKQTRVRNNNLPRKSKLKGKLARLKIRQDNKPADQNGYHYIMPGSMQ